MQPKLTIGPANDVYEREADRVAEQVMRMPDAAVQDEQGFLTAGVNIRRVPEGSGNSLNVGHDIKLDPSGGRPLSASTRRFMDPRFGADFGHVRLHTNQDAQQAALQVQARAFTYGNHIWLGKGASEGDKALLAHELTHVIQQSSDRSGVQIQRNGLPCQPAGLHPCPRDRVNDVTSAFEMAAPWLVEAEFKMRNYVAAPVESRNREAATALQTHFNWTPQVAQAHPALHIPDHVHRAINNTLTNISQPVHAFCPPNIPEGEDARRVFANSPPAWAGTNCYEFFDPFFGEDVGRGRLRGKIAIHEMMHSWEGMNDVAYEGDDDYPPAAHAAENNADSYAALIRDLG